MYNLIYAPHKSLTKYVSDMTDDVNERHCIGEELIHIMEKHNGMGLAANQIDYDGRVFSMYIEQQPVVLYNPVITWLSSEQILAQEGCLSDPGLYLKVKRSAKITAAWQDIQGQTFTRDLEGIECRVFQHEFDHLCGIMFTDRIGDVKLKMARKKQKQKMLRAVERIASNPA
jgi:peptide deformylase